MSHRVGGQNPWHYGGSSAGFSSCMCQCSCANDCTKLCLSILPRYKKFWQLFLIALGVLFSASVVWNWVNCGKYLAKFLLSNFRSLVSSLFIFYCSGSVRLQMFKIGHWGLYNKMPRHVFYALRRLRTRPKAVL